jgi:hypothetical protein
MEQAGRKLFTVQKQNPNRKDVGGNQHMKPQEQVTDDLIDRIYREVDETKLGEWEQKFIKSTRDWWKQHRKLSDKQRKRLGELWVKNAKPR